MIQNDVGFLYANNTDKYETNLFGVIMKINTPVLQSKQCQNSVLLVVFVNKWFLCALINNSIHSNC